MLCRALAEQRNRFARFATMTKPGRQTWAAAARRSASRRALPIRRAKRLMAGTVARFNRRRGASMKKDPRRAEGKENACSDGSFVLDSSRPDVFLRDERPYLDV